MTLDRFYWLGVDAPQAGRTITATASSPWGLEQTVTLDGDPAAVRIRLDDELFDLDARVRVVRGDEVLHDGTVARTIANLDRTLSERGDPRGMFSAELIVD